MLSWPNVLDKLRRDDDRNAKLRAMTFTRDSYVGAATLLGEAILGSDLAIAREHAKRIVASFATVDLPTFEQTGGYAFTVPVLQVAHLASWLGCASSLDTTYTAQLFALPAHAGPHQLIHAAAFAAALGDRAKAREYFGYGVARVNRKLPGAIVYLADRMAPLLEDTVAQRTWLEFLVGANDVALVTPQLLIALAYASYPSAWRANVAEAVRAELAQLATLR